MMTRAQQRIGKSKGSSFSERDIMIRRSNASRIQETVISLRDVRHIRLQIMLKNFKIKLILLLGKSETLVL